jgi:hypothetical protein
MMSELNVDLTHSLIMRMCLITVLARYVLDNGTLTPTTH